MCICVAVSLTAEDKVQLCLYKYYWLVRNVSAAIMLKMHVSHIGLCLAEKENLNAVLLVPLGSRKFRLICNFFEIGF